MRSDDCRVAYLSRHCASYVFQATDACSEILRDPLQLRARRAAPGVAAENLARGSRLPERNGPDELLRNAFRGRHEDLGIPEPEHRASHDAEGYDHEADRDREVLHARLCMRVLTHSASFRCAG